MLWIPDSPGVTEATVGPGVEAPPWPVIQGIIIVAPGHGIVIMVLMPLPYMTGADDAATPTFGETPPAGCPLQAAQSASG